MRLTEVARPGVMISQVWPDSREKEGETQRALEICLKTNFFQAFQTVEIPCTSERRAIAAILRKDGFPLTYCLARVLNENRLNLSDLEAENRKRSVEKVVECLMDAREAGASAVSLISGPVPHRPEMRLTALELLQESLLVICEEAGKGLKLQVMIEPLDWFAHKRNTLGSTAEAAALCDALAEQGRELHLCLDSAHISLNGEEPFMALNLARRHTAEFHFCNCVTEQGHTLFGDRHLPFGAPGVIGVEDMGLLMREFAASGYFDRVRRPSVFCEVLKREQDESEKLLEYCRRALLSAWEYGLEN